MRASIYCIIILLLFPGAVAGTLQGKVYDFSLDPVEAIVTINTTPAQQEVANPEYSFEVSEGSYAVTAKRYDESEVIATTTENFTVEGDGVYVLDLVLFPDVAVNESLNETVNPDEFSYWEPVNRSLPYLSFASILILVWALYYSKALYERKEQDVHGDDEHDEEHAGLDEDAQQILDFIDDEQRVTQKQIRDEFPYSQSKISLILTDLEDKGYIRKVKQGRGNVIIRD